MKQERKLKEKNLFDIKFQINLHNIIISINIYDN